MPNINYKKPEKSNLATDDRVKKGEKIIHNVVLHHIHTACHDPWHLC